MHRLEGVVRILKDMVKGINLLGMWLNRTAVKINLELFLYGIKGLKREFHPPQRMGQKWHETQQILKRSLFTVSSNPCCVLLSESFFSEITFTMSSPISCGPACLMWTSTIPALPVSNFSPLLSSLTGPLAFPSTSSKIPRLHGSFPLHGCPSPFSFRIQAAHSFRPNLISHPLQIHSWLHH